MSGGHGIVRLERLAEGAMEELASLCEHNGWELELDPYSHDHGYDREGVLTIRTPEVIATLKAAGESWDRAAWLALGKVTDHAS